ncbi:KUP/HAK/KT family potassium transporter [Parachryseolinea silvisoli]|uniref:KUP/HAK/KT family potassium transporter n=1 Tax=Parachryseolinea silvisoli TaxID=2873601 RepID=UPI002265F29E|nr:KUP/HAK/KT family potassium transporter [Parachryseolinea silvisoli]MCD9017101.1 KUP/HAK/KT family potassium transporter [Parachryseolinea silvisoli]
MTLHSSEDFHKRVTGAGLLIAVGIVFGDIGTSPLYTLNAIFHGRQVTEDVALGAFSAIFWTLFFQTTLKYVLITLQADNKGEGGILSLYALIRRYWGRWLLIPAMAGGAFLIADGIITPPISVSSAIEGLQKIYPNIQTEPIVIVILLLLFTFQQFGTERIGKIFGPVMVVWFTFIGIIGFMSLVGRPDVLKAFNPYYAWVMLQEIPGGFWLLGSVFLCTTGAEALYSDMGHCGRANIRISWIYVKAMLLLSYAGQTAWLLNHTGQHLEGLSPFYLIVPDSLYLVSVAIATFATIIASQALISGCFTLINEAIRLDIWPRLRVIFPGSMKGQLYIPFINWFLMTGCIAMVLYFRESTRMEAAYGLSITLTMLMSTVLIAFYLYVKHVSFVWVFLVTTLFLVIESCFLWANLQKFSDGGWITILMGALLCTVMYIWHRGRSIKRELTTLVDIEAYIPKLKQLSEDDDIQKYATNLVYLTTSASHRQIEKTAIYSILAGLPKRADVYWFVHVNVLDEPYALRYKVDTIAKNDVYFIEFNLGFRVDPRIDFYFRQVLHELVQTKEVDLSDSEELEYQQTKIGDIRFLILDSFLSFDNDMPFWKNLLVRSYFNLKAIGVKEAANFGLDESNVTIEKYPVVVTPVVPLPLERDWH